MQPFGRGQLVDQVLFGLALGVVVAAVGREQGFVLRLRFGGQDQCVRGEAVRDRVQRGFGFSFGRDRPVGLGSIGPGGGALGLGDRLGFSKIVGRIPFPISA